MRVEVDLKTNEEYKETSNWIDIMIYYIEVGDFLKMNKISFKHLK